MNSPEKCTFVDDSPRYRKRQRVLLSCTECHRRKQKGLCRYENNDSKSSQRNTTSESTTGSGQSRIEFSISHLPSLSDTNSLSPQDNENLVSILGYSSYSKHNTFSVLRQIGATSPSTSSRLSDLDNKRTALDQKYRSIVRQLPSKEHIDILVQQFFSIINWQYDVIDEINFRQQLENWRRIPYSAHTNALVGLPADVFAFPSLLFQVMAHALIHQPVTDGTCSSLESLKYFPEMTFVDLACDFSEAGFSFLELSAKQEVTVVAVQSGILRASLLKNTGKVIESWHVLGIVIRNAQEIGLHVELTTQDPLASTDAQWEEEIRRRLWFVLHNWDIHMAVVLGRPITSTMTCGNAPSPPEDLAHREAGKPPRKRTGNDPPTPSSVIHLGYVVAYQYFPQIHDLESRGARTEDYSIVQGTHAAILDNMDSMPVWSRHHDLEVHSNGNWLQTACLALTSGIHFVLLSLHRPYIFSVAESRTEALKAAQKILAVQNQSFHLSDSQQYISFNMVYPLFDAMVISLAIIVLFPNENYDVRSELVQNMRWGLDMLSKISEHNEMAQSAYNVVKKLFSQLGKLDVHALQRLSHKGDDGMTQRSGAETASHDRAKTCLDEGSMLGSIDAEFPSPTYQEKESWTWNFTDSQFETLLPPQPVHDLFYQGIHVPDMQDPCQGLDTSLEIPEFDGHCPDNSFWSFMSNFSGS